MAQQKHLKLAIYSDPIRIDLDQPDALMRAAMYDQAESIQTLLDRGKSVDTIGPTGWTALHVASFYGRSSIANTLLSYSANTEIEVAGRTALHLAAEKGHTDVLALLIKNKANVHAKTSYGVNALYIAAENGRENAVHILAENTENLEEKLGHLACTPLYIACRQCHSQCTAELLSVGADPNARAEFGTTPLMAAAMSDDATSAIILLDSGAEIDAEADGSATATVLAAFNGSTSVLKVFMSKRVTLDKLDRLGNDALQSAISQGQSETALFLLQEPYPTRRHYGEHRDTALHLAVSGNMCEVVEALLDNGADIEARDMDGDTALQYAVEGNRMKMVKILLRKGAQINKRNENTGETVLHWAVKCGLTSMTQALLAHGSDPSLVDLGSLRKDDRYIGPKEIDEDDFEACKLLLQTKLIATTDVRPAEQFEWPITQDSESNTDDIHNSVASHPAHSDSMGRMKNPIYQIEGQAVAEPFITQFQDKVVHESVKCTGPCCSFQSNDLRGIRYNCTWCDQVNLCSRCVGSTFNRHENHHPMIKCYLPTQIYTVYEVDENTKRIMMLTDPESTGNIQDISHVMYVVTDQHALSQLKASLSQDLNLDWSQVASLLNEPSNSKFAIYKPQSRDLDLTKLEILNKACVKTDNLSLSQSNDDKNTGLDRSSDGKVTMDRDPERIVHHQDSALLTRIMVGSVKRYDYQEDKNFYKWSQEGRAVTRLVDLKPGAFDDRLEIELRTVDIMQALSFEALSYTWKETAYERSLMGDRNKEEEVRLRQSGKWMHAVYRNDSAGNEMFWTINTGLRDALLRLRDPHQVKTLWIDQLCINQRDLRERSFQVSYMMKYYNQAQRVIVWTGEEDEHTRAVFDIYEKIAHVHRSIKKYPRPDEFARLAAIPTMDSPTLEMLFNFFRRPVFGRSWCIQEIVVGQEVIVRCGNCAINWADIASSAKVLVSVPWVRALEAQEVEASVSRKPDVESVNTWVERLYGSLLELVGINELREIIRSKRLPSLERLLYTTSRFQTSEVKDKIYSVLGICSRHGSLDNINPDYELSDGEAFTTATRFCIAQSKSMHVCGMMSGISAKRVVGLPSWVPDYTTNDFDLAFPFSRPSPKIPYNACGDVESTAAWPYEKHQDVLVTSSCHIGTVGTCSQYMSSNKELAKSMMEWSNLLDAVSKHPTGLSIPDVFVLTCFADSAGPSRLRPHPNAEGFLDAVKLVITYSYIEYLQQNPSESGQMNEKALGGKVVRSIMTESFEKFATIMNVDLEDAAGATPEDQTSDQDKSETRLPEHLPEDGSSRDVSASLLEEDEATAGSSSTKVTVNLGMNAPQAQVDPDLDEAARNSLFITCRGRKIFITSDNYFGLGPRDMQSGDEIHILSGTKVPFILRRITTTTTNAHNFDSALIGVAANDGLDLYEMIGECFMHGFMQGEVMERSDLVWKRVAIC